MPEYKNTAGKKKPKKSNYVFNTIRLLLFWVVVAALITAMMGGFNTGTSVKEEEKSITEIIAYADEGKLEKITVEGAVLHVKPKEDADLPAMVSRKETAGTLQEPGFENAINNKLVQIEVIEEVDVWGTVLNIATLALPIAALAGLLIYMMRQAQNMNSQNIGFGKAKARVYGPDKKKVKFEDVAGNESAKQDLSEIVDFLKNPKKYEKIKPCPAYFKQYKMDKTLITHIKGEAVVLREYDDDKLRLEAITNHEGKTNFYLAYLGRA